MRLENILRLPQFYSCMWFPGTTHSDKTTTPRIPTARTESLAILNYNILLAVSELSSVLFT
jgi:hypothetical protein